MRFKFPSLSGGIKNLNDIEGGVSFVDKGAETAPMNAYSSCITFQNDTYSPQIFITWNGIAFIRGTNVADAEWKKIVTEDL